MRCPGNHLCKIFKMPKPMTPPIMYVLAIETIPFNVLNDEMVRETRKDHHILSVVYDCLLKGRELPQSA